jgi:hypothetical protein
MTLLIAAFALTSQGLSPNEIFGKMLTKYFSAKSLTGTIEFNQSAEGRGEAGKATVKTSVAMKQPNFFAVDQNRVTSNGSRFRAICDGKQIAMTTPKDWAELDPLKRVMYFPAPEGIGGALDNFASILLDRQLPIAVALYNVVEVTAYVRPIRNLKLHDEVTIEGQPAYRLQGDYALTSAGPADPDKVRAVVWTPIYVYISKSFDLLGMVYGETLQFTDPRTRQKSEFKVTNQWVVRLSVDVAVDEAVFKIG